jgi:hypothetical protein
MADRSDIFAKRRLTVGQLRAVADRRFGDAEALVATGDNARANGAQYLAGIVLEIRLKGRLLQGRPHLQTAASGALSVEDRAIWGLIWRSHDLGAMLDRLPQVRVAAERRGVLAGEPYARWLATICGEWTIVARYSAHTSTIAAARAMLEQVRVLKELI